MKILSAMESRCKPNVITYSALMTACCAGGQPEKAHEVFQEMQAAGIKPDQISYSTLIAGTEDMSNVHITHCLSPLWSAHVMLKKDYSLFFTACQKPL